MVTNQRDRLRRWIRQTVTVIPGAAGMAAVGLGGAGAQAVTTGSAGGVTLFDTDPSGAVLDSFALDFDGLGDDLTFIHFFDEVATQQFFGAQVDGANGTQVFAVDGNILDAIRYTAGQAIDGSDPFDDSNKTLASTTIDSGTPGTTFGEFGGTTGGYVGFQLGSGALGWIQVDVTDVNDANPHQITLGDWAFGDPGQGIFAGTTQTFALSTGIVPEPATAALGGLSLLALGAAALRRSRQTVAPEA